MNRFNISAKIIKSSESELKNEEKTLIELAKQATAGAYCPYSGFRVGAAVRLAGGLTVCGSNQENVAYPSGLCAERTALFAASAQHPGVAVEAIAIAAFTDGRFTRMPVSPCGACRQVMLEIEQRYGTDISVYLYGTEGVYIVEKARDLLPLAFDSLDAGD
jgi:cytidine deaminase